jgi:hypothetical protein
MSALGQSIAVDGPRGEGQTQNRSCFEEPRIHTQPPPHTRNSDSEGGFQAQHSWNACQQRPERKKGKKKTKKRKENKPKKEKPQNKSAESLLFTVHAQSSSSSSSSSSPLNQPTTTATTA